MSRPAILRERFSVPVIRQRIFRQDYAKASAIWRSNFRAAWPNLMPSDFHRVVFAKAE
jgi:cyclopropane-fatty-acyl-phospholipid synthase